VVDAADASQAYLSQRARVAMNPASVMKLVTTYAALDLLGPAHTWHTAVYTDGPVVDGVLQGNLYLQGGGDPKLVSERLWLLMRRIQGLGLRRIAGDIVLDRRAWSLPPADPAAFDGEPLRPYNAAPDALLVNFRSLMLTFSPDPAGGAALVSMEPPLAGVSVPARVPMQGGQGGGCGDWRAGLKADFTDPLRIRFNGAYPAACGEKTWPVAYAAPERFAERAALGMWQAVGGQLDGQAREGAVPAGLAPRLLWPSLPLAEVVRDVNKFSNNVMAQQLLLSLAPAGPGTPATFEAARQRVGQWWRERISAELPVPEIDNGAGLSRSARVSAQALARLLQVAYLSGQMPELMASLPLSGHDGTLRRSQNAVGLAHLKTGSLNDVVSLAGYVHAANGRRLILVALVNHPNASAARPALNALIEWAASPP